MSKYIKRFRSISSATSTEDIISPHLSVTENNNEHKLLMLNAGNNTPLKICGDSLSNLEIKEKVIITYSSLHGTCPKPKSICKGYTLTSVDLPTLSEEGWTFKGWDKSIGYIVNENTTITASWEEAVQTVTITYVSSKGTAPASKQVPKGYALTDNDLPDLTVENEIFAGWRYNEHFDHIYAVSAGDIINEDTTIYVNFFSEMPINYSVNTGTAFFMLLLIVDSHYIKHI